MATLIPVVGEWREVYPENGTHFRVAELIKLLGGRGGRIVCGPSLVRGATLAFLDIGPESLAGLNQEANLKLAVSNRRLIYGAAILGSELELSCPEDQADVILLR